MSEIVKLGSIKTQAIKKIANSINKIPNTDEGTRNAINIVKEAELLTNEKMSSRRMENSNTNKENVERDTRRAMFDGTGNAAKTVNERLNEAFER